MLVDGQVGTLVTVNGRQLSILAFTVVKGKIVKINAIRCDRVRL